MSTTRSGDGLTVATAGVSASFTIISRDVFGNQRMESDDVFIVRVFPTSNCSNEKAPSHTQIDSAACTVCNFISPVHTFTFTPVSVCGLLKRCARDRHIDWFRSLSCCLHSN